MGLDKFSDYGSGSSSSSAPWLNPESSSWPPHQPRYRNMEKTQRPSSFHDLATGQCTIDDVMQEFRMNGHDSPYNPDEDRVWRPRTEELAGLGPAGQYLRQKSWPEPERTPAARLPSGPGGFATSTPINDVPDFTPSPTTLPQTDVLTEEQLRVLNSLPSTVLYSLLRDMETARGDKRVKRRQTEQECRFCKNNGERESYYRSHPLKAGGRVACPVLRAFRCARCGAAGDHAHTLKYCPLTTHEERMKSVAMMRSVRMASGRRRLSANLTPSSANDDNYQIFGETPSYGQNNNLYNNYVESAPLDPLWAALEQKLML